MIQHRRSVDDHVRAAAQVMCRLTPTFRAIQLDGLQSFECRLQVVEAAGSFALLKLRIARDARTDTVVRQSHELAARDAQYVGLQFRLLRAVTLQLCEHGHLQMPPLAHGLGQPITLLPAMRAMLRCPFLLLDAGFCFCVCALRAQAVFECVQHVRDVIDELRARAGRR